MCHPEFGSRAGLEGHIMAVGVHGLRCRLGTARGVWRTARFFFAVSRVHFFHVNCELRTHCLFTSFNSPRSLRCALRVKRRPGRRAAPLMPFVLRPSLHSGGRSQLRPPAVRLATTSGLPDASSCWQHTRCAGHRPPVCQNAVQDRLPGYTALFLPLLFHRSSRVHCRCGCLVPAL